MLRFSRWWGNYLSKKPFSTHNVLDISNRYWENLSFVKSFQEVSEKIPPAVFSRRLFWTWHGGSRLQGPVPFSSTLRGTYRIIFAFRKCVAPTMVGHMSVFSSITPFKTSSSCLVEWGSFIYKFIWTYGDNGDFSILIKEMF